MAKPKVCYVCSKEREIGEMHTDIKWIRSSLEGNGHTGLFRRVALNTAFRNVTTGGLVIISIVTGWIITIIY